MAEPQQSTFAQRLGAMIIAPRKLARRDLDARDGKAGDDLFVVALGWLMVLGVPSLLRMVGALLAGRSNTALRLLSKVLVPGLPLLAVWVVATLLFMAFTFRTGRKSVSELGARVTQGFVMTNAVLAGLEHYVPEAGTLAYVLDWSPLAVAALLFGLLLREALEPPGGEGALVPPPIRSPVPGLVLLTIGAALLVVRVHHTWERLVETPIEARAGKPAPPVDLPLLGGGKLQTVTLGGRTVVLTFWATWCGPCLEELPTIQKLYAARGPNAAVLYAVNVDDAGPNRDRLIRGVVGRLGLTMPIALDDGSASAAYSVSSIPTSARIGTDGQLAEIYDRPLGEPELADLLK